MLIRYGSQLHYRCSFDLVPNEDTDADWGDIIKDIRYWISERYDRQPGLGGKWFFTGGDWRPSHLPGLRVQTICSNSSVSPPRHWAIRYEHNCDSVRFRRWQTDIGVTRQPDRYRFVLSNAHFLRPDFIGNEPDPPPHSAPRLVTRLLGSSRWTAMGGADRLTAEPIPLAPGRGVSFRQTLETKDRPPLVLIALHHQTQQHKIDPFTLARLLAGAATIYYATTSEVDKELEYVLPHLLHCWNGMVRIYQPGVMLEHEPDARRHRFFTHQEVEKETSQRVTDIIIRGVVRRGRVWIGDAVATIEDVAAQQRDMRLVELRSESKGQPTSEWIALLESDNEQLSLKLRQRDQELAELEAERDDLEDQVAGRNHEFRQALYQRARLVSDMQELRTQLEALKHLSCLPDGLPAVVELIERLHAGRIAFTDTARRTAEKSTFDDPREVWSCLWQMATTLHRLYFDDSLDPASIMREFKSQTGYELSVTEGELTKRDKSLMEARKVQWNDQELDITAHIKCVKRGKHLRVHFHPLRSERLIVVGHCGDHMTTSGTRRMS